MNDITKYNGKVVCVNIDKLTEIRRNYKGGECGITFTAFEDGNHSMAIGYNYIHFVTPSDFCRIPIEALKIVNKKVSASLKEKALKLVDDYLTYGYLDNLAYAEAVNNIKRIKTL